MSRIDLSSVLQIDFLDKIGDPIVFVNKSGEILRVNPAAEKMLHLDSSSIGRRVGDIFGLSVDDMLVRAWERNSHISAVTTVRYLDPVNPPVFNVSVSPLDENLSVMIWQDITSLHDAERIRVDHEKAATKRVLDTFSRYMSAKLADRILSDPDILTRRELRDAVVLFADLRGFTRLTVEQPPNLALSILNDWFSQMMEIVNNYEGLVFNTAGDELMISFNVPYAQHEVNKRALMTAIAMQNRFAAMQNMLVEEQITLGMGIGINRGLVVLGHVGGQHRMTYTMVGEAVNIAHRLVEVAEDAQIVVTPELVQEGVPESIKEVIREAHPMRFKGKDDAQPIFIIDIGRTNPMD